ncbi:hypothetical protein C0Q70_18818 [Pomacea canaliculata]|uniref:Neurotransmitter-gated ion-channel transmembrane domain-containing protein n=1 Tax=Pomacea canaliculata TaxID=400727 RepID=A0A2T7NHK9_POMCA|nr:hypothetical protein C0Q70_18818 [Pomacea canaliculata]
MWQSECWVGAAQVSSMCRGNYTCISADFKLKRQVGYYIAQVYVPSVLIVILSWVSFWIDLDATPARVSLGLLTVLTLTTQSTGEKAYLPRVSYLKALDVWMAGCLVFVFAALLEFAYGNVQSRVSKRRKDTPSNITSQTNLSINPSGPQLSQPPTPPPIAITNPCFGDVLTNSTIGNGSFGNGSFRRGSLAAQDHLRKMSQQEIEQLELEISQIAAFMKSLSNLEKARMVDKVSRVAFPVAFIIFNIVYWLVYLVDF